MIRVVAGMVTEAVREAVIIRIRRLFAAVAAACFRWAEA